jgi:hypothetical protein
MQWSEFTQDHINIIKKKQYSVKANNIMLQHMKEERKEIKKLIQNKLIDCIDIKLLESNILDKDIAKYANVSWVSYYDVMKELPKLPIVCMITWNKNNKMYIKTTSDQLLLIKKRLKYIIAMIQYLMIKSNKQIPITIYLVLTKLNKQFPNKNKVIDITHANTGYTDLRENIIFIWRLEEFEKVLFHETLHFADMDSRDLKYDKLNSVIKIQGKECYYEAVTDYWAIFYYIIYLSLVTHREIKTLLELELGFIKNQAQQLYNIMGLDKTKIIVQKTPAYSYYILKYMLFEYALQNKLSILGDHDYNMIFKNLIKKSELYSDCRDIVKFDSSRMTLLQLK